MSQTQINEQAPIAYPAKHGAYAWKGDTVDSVDALFAASCPDEKKRAKSILHSSFPDSFTNDAAISSSENGLVYAIFSAYNHHHHLILRPEDIWFAILTQFSFYVNANAEKLRKHFVAHSGRKRVVVSGGGSFFEANIGALAVQLTERMNEHLVDPELKEWIMPNFTTTTETDTATAAVLMMGSMQAYFKYEMMFACGIPSVTLLGDKQDWKNIRQRLNKLAEFGEEPEHFGRLLMPVLDMFVKTFEDPISAGVNDFWNKVCFRQHGLCGSGYINGWITAFIFWNEQGKVDLYGLNRRVKPHKKPASLVWKTLSSLLCLRKRKRDVEADTEKNTKKEDDLTDSETSSTLTSDETKTFDISIYGMIDEATMPNGFVSVPVLVNDNGLKIWTRMVAGSVGMRITSTGEAIEQEPEWRWSDEERTSVRICEEGKRPGLDTIQPVSGWWMYGALDKAAEEAAYNKP